VEALIFLRFNNALSVTKGEAMNPSSIQLLDLLISLYAEQEGVKITYEVEI
jgi:hypothetical protein